MAYIGNDVDAVFIPESVNTSTSLRITGGDLIVDGNTLYVDESTNNVGIGTSTPQTRLDIYGEGEHTVQLSLRQWNDNSGSGIDGPDLRFIASGGTIASPVEMDDNDVIGKVNAFAYDGTSSVQYGGFGWRYRTDGLGNRGSSFELETKPYSGSNSTRLRVTENARVLINSDTEITGLFGSAVNYGATFNVATTASEFSGVFCSYRDNTTYNGLSIAKSKTTTPGGHGLIGANEYISAISFDGSDGTQFISAGVIRVGVEGTPAEGNMPSFMEFMTNSGSATTSTSKMRITSTGNVGIGTTNPTSELHVLGETLSGNLNLSAIDDEIILSATSIFVYDTSKDSDGGAWRKRTQHTSWYNETLNTATRGSRREFPAVAVIVAEATQVTIYNGDDPDLPLWITFPTTNAKGISALNGELCLCATGTAPAYHSLLRINFIADQAINHRENTDATVQGYFKYTLSSTDLTLLDNGASSWTGYRSEVPNIVNRGCNDVAMTVLPNAPIDPSTGLPVPTIAVATDGGVSVIKDDGTVVDITETTGPNSVREVTFRKSDGKLGFRYSDTSGNNDYMHIGYCPIPSSDKSVSYFYSFLQSTFPGWEDHSYNQGGTDFSDAYPSVMPEGDSLGDGTALIDNNVGTNLGLIRINENPTSPANGMVAYATTSYNTGWQHGNIKGAFLADTDDTDVVETELVTNGTFNSDISGWSDGSDVGGSISWNSSGYLDVIYSTGIGRARQDITVEIGKVYVISFDVIAESGSINGFFYAGSTGNGIDYVTQAVNVGSYSFTVTTITTLLSISFRGFSAAGTLTVDNVSVRIADPDRSVNAKGLQVFGTITKSPVATGAELVGYSGWSSSNYLLRPYSTDVQIGTSNACHMGWFKTSSTSGERMIVSFEGVGTYGTAFNVRLEAGNRLMGWVTNNSFASSANVQSSYNVNDGIWHYFAWVKNNGTYSLYLDGNLMGSTTYSNDLSFTNNSESIIVGNRNRQKENPFTSGEIALIRFSLTAPSPDQIRKIYEDEKVLFQEGSACTLYGTSDAVTALAYDETTELLHVGTSSGRSEFKGLRRVGNTTTPVTTAISASNGLVAEQ